MRSQDDKARFRITRIEPQKKRKGRLNVYIDGAFAFGVDQRVALEHAIHEGDGISKEKMDAILLDEEKARAKDKALALLSYRSRSVAELRKKLLEKGFSERTVGSVVDDLLRVGLLDDVRFASAYVHSRMLQKPMGKRLLMRELFQKGIDEETAEKSIDEGYEGRSEADIARELAEKRIARSGGEGRKARKRLADFLLRRGFGWDVIQPVLQDTRWKSEE